MKISGDNLIVVCIGLFSGVCTIVSLWQSSVVGFFVALGITIACLIFIVGSTILSTTSTPPGDSDFATEAASQRIDPEVPSRPRVQVESRPQRIYPFDSRPNQAYYRQAFLELSAGKIVPMEQFVLQFCQEFQRWMNYQVGSYLNDYPGSNHGDTEERFYVAGIELILKGKLGNDEWRSLAHAVEDRVHMLARQFGNPV